MTDLKSPTTMLLAWVLVPALIVFASGGIGLLLARISGATLGALTVPAGFAGGIVAYTFFLQAGASALVCSLLVAALVIAGYLLAWRAASRDKTDGGPRAKYALGIAALAGGAIAFIVGMAPLVGTGRMGVLGYVLLNDPAWHISLIEWIHQYGHHTAAIPTSSYASVSAQIGGGYPLGTYAWSLFSMDITGVAGFAIWTPVIAVAMGMTAIVCFDVIRRMGVSLFWSAIAGAAVAIGYLPLSYLAQGGSKELIFTFTFIFSAAAVSAVSLSAGDGFVAMLRRCIPTAVGVAAMAFVFGPGSIVWIGPLAAALLALLMISPPAGVARKRIWLLTVAWGAVVFVLTIPAIVAIVQLLGTVTAVSEDASQTGNLIGPVPIREIFNAWISQDYRAAVPRAGFDTWSHVALAVAAFFAVLGGFRELFARRLFIPIAGFAGIVSIVYLTRQYNDYFVAKAFVAIAPAVGCATVAGIAWLFQSGGLRKATGIAGAALLLLTLVVSTAGVYRSIFITPQARFQELASLNQKYAGEGPALVVEREEYARLLLKDVKPWEEYGMFAPGRGFRKLGGGSPPHTPDVDDFTTAHVNAFPLIIARKQPGGSRPPSNFTLVDETKHYEVWQRDGSEIAVHTPIGQFTASGTAPLKCDAASVRATQRVARTAKRSLAVASGKPIPLVIPIQKFEQKPALWSAPGPAGFEIRTTPNQTASKTVKLKPGHTYDVYMQGSWGGGVELFHGDTPIGKATEDLGQLDQWQTFAPIKATGDDLIRIVSRPTPLWRAGAARGDLIGSVAFVDRDTKETITRTSVAGLADYCGKQVDWIEVSGK